MSKIDLLNIDSRKKCVKINLDHNGLKSFKGIKNMRPTHFINYTKKHLNIISH
jgi:hypothetical protein